jgi:hypothetical protein
MLTRNLQALWYSVNGKMNNRKELTKMQMAPAVFFTVCYPPYSDIRTAEKLHTFNPAVLHGYCRHRVQDADYPGIIAEEGKSVLGVYVTGLTDAMVGRLDQFEGSEYDRVRVKVSLVVNKNENENGDGMDEGHEKDTSVYVFSKPQYLERREWDFEEFRTEKMSKWSRHDYVFEGVFTNSVDTG